MRPPPYPKHKPIGIAWVHEIPEHWEVGNLRRFAQMKTGHTPSRYEREYWEDCDIPWFTLADVWQLRDGRQTYLGDTKEKISRLGLMNSAAELLPTGTVVFSRTASVGFSGIMPVPMATTQDFWNWIPGNRLISEFLVYVFRAMRQEFDRLTMGSTHKTIYQPDAARISVCVPPIMEQRAIVDFLDGETAKLDTLVTKKRELIEKLKEKRSALTSRTVTRGLPPEAARAAGLNPNPKLKPSGIEWLGEIPEHWEVKRVKHVGYIRYGLGEPPEYVDDGLAFIRATDIKQGKIDLDSVRKVSPTDIPWSRRPQLAEGEILVVRSGAYTGDSAIVTQEVAGNIAGYDMVFAVTGSVPQFVAWVLLSKYMLESQILLARLRAAQPHLNAEELGDFLILVPPTGEQRAIADYLDSETNKIDRMVAKVEEAIERLQEYRTALITAAVTGKIDVRNVRHSGENRTSGLANDTGHRPSPV